VSNFDGAISLQAVIKVSTHALYLGPYSLVQEWLFERVRSLRDSQRLTFRAIAEQLTKFGAKSARGKPLAAEHVFSIYKRGKAYKARLAEEPTVEVVDLKFGISPVAHGKARS
jgi:hypothetical protein